MSGFTVEPADLDAAAGALRGAADETRAELARLAHIAADLFDAGWAGPAAAAFEAGWLQWRSGAEQVLGALEQVGAALQRCGDGYAAAERASRDAVCGGAR